MSVDTPAVEPESQDEVFGSGFKLFLWVAGGIFAAIAISIPMVIIAQSMNTIGGGGGTPPAALEPGEQIALDAGCMACHTTDGSDAVGPTWLGLAGSERTLTSGETVIADDAYLRNSIVDPDSQIVEGFTAGQMPNTYEDDLSADDIDAIVDFINTRSPDDCLRSL